MAQHYVGDLVYGTNDGVLTSFAVVAGVTGGALSTRTVLIVGMANLFADGLSMGVGNYLSIRARESALEHDSRSNCEVCRDVSRSSRNRFGPIDCLHHPLSRSMQNWCYHVHGTTFAS